MAASLMRAVSRLGPRVLTAATLRPPSSTGPVALGTVALWRQSTGELNAAVLRPASRLISTSKKNKDAVTVGDKAHHPPAKQEKLENIEAKEENWISYGYDIVDRDIDEWAHHLVLFCVITLTFCWGSLFFAYFPDFKDNAWAQRDAYLELARREKEGLPLIDPNLIDPSKIELPSEEELGDFDIVI